VLFFDKLARPLQLAALGAFSWIALSSGTASAAPITKELTIEVYQICDNLGGNCAQLGPAADLYYANSTSTIWAQAGIGVNFHFAGQIFDSDYLMIVDDDPLHSFAALQAEYGGGGPSTSTVYMFLNHGIGDSVEPSLAYGEGWFGYGGLVMDMDAIMGYSNPSGLGRIDTMAHELGHNFGLVQPSQGGDGGAHHPSTNYLMASGAWRDVPQTTADVYPSGAGLDVIPLDQILYARGSSLLHDVPVSAVPEPASLSLAGAGLFALVLIRRRRS